MARIERFEEGCAILRTEQSQMPGDLKAGDTVRITLEVPPQTMQPREIADAPSAPDPEYIRQQRLLEELIN